MTKIIYNILLLLILYIFWISSQNYFDNNFDGNIIIIDKIHDSEIVSYINNLLSENINFTRFIFILTTLMIDINILYYVYDFLKNNNYKPIMLLILGIMLRQLCQYVNRLPIPRGMVWMDPLFPTLTMNYQVTSDFFWSGHTFTALLFGVEIMKSKNYLVKLYGFVFLVSEIGFILVTRGHYFMDVYAAVTSYFTLLYFFNLIKK
jgi:hypothetical protein